MTDSAIMGEPFRIGSCLKRAITTFGANFISFNLLGLTVIVPGLILVSLLFGVVFASVFLGIQAPNATPPDIGALHFGTFAIVWVTMLSLQYLLTAVIVFGALRYLQGQKAGYGACMAQGIRRLIPIVIIAVVSTILMAIGFFLLFVPGIIIALMICLAIPVLMVENPGSLGSLSRSRALTKGYRWHLLGLFLLAFVVTALVSAVVLLPLHLLTLVSESFSVVGAIAHLLIQFFTTVFLAVVLAVAYHDLRVAKEGVSTAQLAAVFD